MKNEILNLPLFQNPDLDGGPFFLSGNETGVLLIHGFTATTVEVRLIGELFNQKGYTVSAPLLPGHNTTPADLNNTSKEQWKTAVEAAFLQLNEKCSRIYVCGESLGGLLTLYLVSQHKEIAGIALFAPALKVPGMYLTPILKYFIKYQPKKGSGKDDYLPWKGYRVNPIVAASQVYQLQREVKKLLPTIQTPTLIFQGAKDQTIDPLSSELVYQNIGSEQKEFIYLEKSGHCILLDREYKFVFDKTEQFFNKSSK